MGSKSSDMVQLTLKALLLISLGQYFVMGGEDKDEEAFFEQRRLYSDDIRRIFNEYDADKDGRLSYKECRDKTPERPEAAARKKFEKFDENDDEFLDFSEFSKLVKHDIRKYTRE